MASTTWSDLPSTHAEIGTTPERARGDHRHLFALGVDRHDVPVPLARMVENVLDWEHLPWVHPENFVSSELIGSGRGWYRARFGNAGGTYNQVLVMLHTHEPDRSRWTILLEDGPRAGHLVHTVARSLGPCRIETVVTFYAPEPPRNDVVRRAMFAVFKRQYDQLYVQDTVMMSERDEALRHLQARTTDVPLGSPLGRVEELAKRAPFVVTVAGRRFWIRAEGDGLSVAAADCPHQRGLLPCPVDDQDTVVCPWHGYRFDVRGGRSNDGRSLRLDPPPRLMVDEGLVYLHPPVPGQR